MRLVLSTVDLLAQNLSHKLILRFHSSTSITAFCIHNNQVTIPQIDFLKRRVHVISKVCTAGIAGFKVIRMVVKGEKKEEEKERLDVKLT